MDNGINLKKLLDPIPVKWRVQSFSKIRAQAACVPYVDARDVMRRLDEVCGPENWQDDYKEVGDLMLAGIGIKCGDNWIWKWDTGVETKIEKEKGLVSDSFKRAGVKWGVARFLYSLDVIYLPANEKKTQNNYPHVVDGSKKRIYDLTAYINESLAGKPSSEDKKISAYWEAIADQCHTSNDLIRFWHDNQGSIGQWLDEDEEGKLKSYLSQLKRVLYEGEELVCPQDETGETKVFKIVCVDECKHRERCQAWS